MVQGIPLKRTKPLMLHLLQLLFKDVPSNICEHFHMKSIYQYPWKMLLSPKKVRDIFGAPCRSNKNRSNQYRIKDHLCLDTYHITFTT